MIITMVVPGCRAAASRAPLTAPPLQGRALQRRCSTHAVPHGVCRMPHCCTCTWRAPLQPTRQAEQPTYGRRQEQLLLDLVVPREPLLGVARGGQVARGEDAKELLRGAHRAGFWIQMRS